MTHTAHRQQPAELVDLARALIREQRDDLVGTWSRASAILGRQALEIALGQVWSKAAPGVENASARAQLLCLPTYIDTELASRIRYTWHGLSAACHHHAYELPPTAPELEGWLSDIEALVKELDRRSRT